MGGLKPGTCVVAASYSGQTTGNGVLTLNLTNDYQSGFVRLFEGTSTSRALLGISRDPGDFGCSDDSTCAGVILFGGDSINLLVSNRGGAQTTSLGVGTPLASPLVWGDGGAFPGGAGMGSVLGRRATTTARPRCSAQGKSAWSP